MTNLARRNVFKFYQVKRVFLACPGDLTAERSRFPRLLETVNNLRAHLLGFHLEPVGWERVIPSFDRPQELINKELDSADLAIVMFWNRIGSPSSTNSDKTATIEEFERASESYGKHGWPMVWVYFKRPTARSNQQLTGVLDFRNELEAGKQIFFREFGDVGEWEDMLQEHLVAYLDGLKRWDIDKHFTSMDPREALMQGLFQAEGIYQYGTHLELLADLDGDGNEEKVRFWWSRSSFNLTVEKYDTTLVLELPEALDLAFTGRLHLAIKDVTNDGLPEVLLACENGLSELMVWVWGFTNENLERRSFKSADFGLLGSLHGQQNASIREGGTIVMPYGSAGLAMVARWNGSAFEVSDEVISVS